MSWINNLVAAFSPRKAAEREAWQNVYEELRDYDAGSGGRINQNWRVTNRSAELTDRFSRDRVRARARDLERNSAIMNAVLWARKRNIIGAGFELEARTERSELNTQLEKLWREWTRARNCDVTGTQSLMQMLRMAVTRKSVDGGVMFLKRYTAGGVVPFALQMVEVDELDAMQTAPHNKKNRVIGGVEYNSYNKAVGYWIRTYQVDGMAYAPSKFVKAQDVIFYFTKRRPSQIREMSDMAPTITSIRDANEFAEAVAVKQRIEACLAVFIEQDIPTNGAPRAGGDRTEYDNIKLGPGMVKYLSPGQKVAPINPTGQSADATSFLKLNEKLIAASQGLSYESVSRDLSETTYSSARQGAIEDELAFAEDLEQIEAILDEIYETFVISCVLSGAVKIPGFWREDKKRAYLEHAWVKPPKPWIDPLKEANADKIALQSGQKSFKTICAEHGRDWKDVIDDMVEVEEYAKKQGVDIGGLIYDGKLSFGSESGSDAAPGGVGGAELVDAPGNVDGGSELVDAGNEEPADKGA